MFQSVKRQREYQGYRSGTPELTGPASSMPILIGAAMIAAAILLSTLSPLGSRYVGFEGPTEESAGWSIAHRQLYKCRRWTRQGVLRGRIATGSVAERPKR